MNKTEKEWAVGMLLLGILLGVVGNLAANVLDRYFVQYGPIYDIGIIVIFALLLFSLERTFTKLLKS